MFAPRPRKTEPQNDTSVQSFSVVRCETAGPENREFVVYEILGPPNLFHDLTSGDDLAADQSLETVDDFNIRQRKPKPKSNETTRVSNVGQTSGKSDNQPICVTTYGPPVITIDDDDDDPCESSTQICVDEVQPQSPDKEEGTNEGISGLADAGETATPVRVRKARVKDMSGRSRTPGWHICPQCSYTADRRSMLERHLNVHRDKPRIKCNECELNFGNESALKKHKLSHNTPYKCNQCDSGFSNYLKLERHFMEVHTTTALYSCKECNYSCSRVENMRRHVRSHTGERPYQCPHCTYAGADAFKLKRHILTHLGEKPHKCDKCDARFTQINDLREHQWKHSPAKPHTCDKCGKGFAVATRLRQHLRSMHTAYEKSCRYCNMTLPDKHSYLQHLQSHKNGVNNISKSS